MLKKFWFDTAFAQGRGRDDSNPLRRVHRTDALLVIGPVFVSLFDTANNPVIFCVAAIGGARMFARSMIRIAADYDELEIIFARRFGNPTTLDVILMKGEVNTLQEAAILGGAIGRGLADMHAYPNHTVSDEFRRGCDIAVRAKLMKAKDPPEPCRPDPNVIEGEFSIVTQGAPGDQPRLGQH
jgi:hypothetical protein